jgi:hypothetical protein
MQRRLQGRFNPVPLVVLERDRISGCDGRTNTYWWKRLIRPVSNRKLGSRIATVGADDLRAVMAKPVLVLEAIGARRSCAGRIAR